MKKLVIAIIVFFIVLVTVIVLRHNSLEKKTEYVAKMNKIVEYDEDIFFDKETREIYFENTEDNNYVVLGKNGKLYNKGIIKKKDTIEEDNKLKREFGKYEISILDNKINVKYDGKEIIDEIDYLNSGFEQEKNIPEISNNMINYVNDQIILRNTSYYHYDNSDVLWSESKTYLINRKGIVKTYDGYLDFLYNNEKEIKYLYHLDGSKLTIMDTNFKEIYNTNLEKEFKEEDKEEYDFNRYSCSYSTKPNYCKINDKYIDIIKNKEIDEKTYLYRIIDSKLGYIIKEDEENYSNKLIVYYKDKEVGTFYNIDKSLDGKYFLQKKNKKNIILELNIVKKKK